jgi:hypothetical protein
VALSSCATVVISRSGIWGIASAASEGAAGGEPRGLGRVRWRRQRQSRGGLWVNKKVALTLEKREVKLTGHWGAQRV